MKRIAFGYLVFFIGALMAAVFVAIGIDVYQSFEWPWWLVIYAVIVSLIAALVVVVDE